MVRSLVPLTVLILVMVWLYRPSTPDPVTTVDPAGDVFYAASLASFTVLAPSGLPTGWRPTSARVDPAEQGGPVGLSIGYVTPQGRFAQFVHSSVPVEALLGDVLGKGYTQVGETEIAGQGWQEMRSARDEPALVRSADGAIVVITGSASDAELRALVAALRPAPG